MQEASSLSFFFLSEAFFSPLPSSVTAVIYGIWPGESADVECRGRAVGPAHLPPPSSCEPKTTAKAQTLVQCLPVFPSQSHPHPGLSRAFRSRGGHKSRQLEPRLTAGVQSSFCPLFPQSFALKLQLKLTGNSYYKVFLQKRSRQKNSSIPWWQRRIILKEEVLVASR